jgi:hypothetical protein
VGGSTSRLQATAALTGAVTASNVNGASIAAAGVGADVTGAFGNGTAATDITVGNDLVGGAIFDARSTLGATASSVGANATANAGDGDTTVTGINAVDLTVGDNAGTIFGQATSTVTAAASTSGSLTGQNNATANALQVATGVLDTTTKIGGDGNLTALSTLNGTATASNVGDTTSGDDNAAAALSLTGTGIDNGNAADATVIGGSGNVLGQALTNGGATAQTVNGNANGTAAVTTTGLDLNNAASDITIGRSGNITGLAVIGALTGSTLTDQVGVVASSTSGVAQAGGSFDTLGILGDSGNSTAGTVITAGPKDGSITGSAYGGAKVIASSTGGDAITAINQNGPSFGLIGAATEIVGIKNVDLIGGQVGTNTIVGTGYGKFDSAATSVRGSATGVSNVNVNGILGTPGSDSIVTSGNVTAQATLINTVVARSVSGAATAIATGNVVGLSGYKVTILGSGNIVASASSTTLSTASSTGGPARA